jgi:non-heme chloroperoxidase
MAKRTVIFIHGLWIHSSSWRPWLDFFNQQGYQGLNPAWPGDSPTVAECRANPLPIANRGVQEIADSYAKTIASLSEAPIVIGHSFGGLIAQVILCRGLAATGIASIRLRSKEYGSYPFHHLRLPSRFWAIHSTLKNPNL